MNYSELTNAQFDQMAAVLYGYTIVNENPTIYRNQAGQLVGSDRWNPTDPDSNQVERYLFPKLDGTGYSINIEYGDGCTIDILLADDCGDKTSVLVLEAHDPDQINRTKVIAWLEAMEKTG